jgi:SAM-dependent methyltransferase
MTSRVRDYYETNTRLFLALGLGHRTSTIHRAVWAAGVTSQAAALTYVHGLIAAQLAMLPYPQQVLDLGCGVGATLLDIVAGSATRCGVGVTISATQARLAAHNATMAGLGQRCHFIEADFQRLPLPSSFDLGYAIEALAHAPDPAIAYQQAAACLRPGGLLCICDDFLTATGQQPNNAFDQQLVTTFRHGWQVHGLCTPQAAKEYADAAGLQLVAERNLTPDLRLLTLPTPLTTGLFRLGQCLPPDALFAQSNLGSLALQHCLQRGLVEYRWMVFGKR